MSLTLDLAEIREHFVTNWDAVAVTTIFANQDPATLNKKEPFVRFSILPGDKSVIYGGPTYRQLGRVTLQILVPASRGTVLGYELAETFTELFRDWRSADGAVRADGADIQTFPKGQDGLYQINVSVRWQSMRRP